MKAQLIDSNPSDNASITEPVSVSSLKEYLQVSGTAYDTTYGTFITAARRMVERLTGLALVGKSVIETIKATNGVDMYRLSIAPVATVLTVEAIDSDGTATVLDADEYVTYGSKFKYINIVGNGIYRITYNVNAATDSDLVQAVKAQAGFMFTKRDSEANVGLSVEARALIGSHVQWY
jgi:hypothetical protein